MLKYGFQRTQRKSAEVQRKYAELNKENEIEWGVREHVEALVIDASDLLKLIQAKEGFRTKENVDAKIVHELCDCLWSILVVADKLEIELGDVFGKEMDVLKSRIESS